MQRPQRSGMPLQRHTRDMHECSYQLSATNVLEEERPTLDAPVQRTGSPRRGASRREDVGLQKI